MSQASVANPVHEVPRVNVVPLGTAVRRIEIQGVLPAGWAGRLATGLAAQRINVVRGWAEDRESAGWEAQIDVELPQYTLDLTPATVLLLASPTATPLFPPTDGLELLDFKLVQIDGDLAVEVEAADAQGFLERMLRLFALYDLTPREMSVETSDGMVHDVFRLRGPAGAPPEAQAVAALEVKLQRVKI
jgi:hypothetical protein